MRTRRILIVDDEPDLCRILRFNLEAAGFDTDEAHCAAEAMERDPASFHLALIDVMMPDMSGFELAGHLREANPRLPIVFLTALNSESDVLHGFALGADDYISKPFSVREVIARVKAVVTRATAMSEPQTVTAHYRGLTADMENRSATIDGAAVHLTPTEFDLLWLLLTHRGRVFSRGELIRHVWPAGVVVTDRTVDVNITRLRKKIMHYGRHIATRQGFGYYFDENEKEQ